VAGYVAWPRQHVFGLSIEQELSNSADSIPRAREASIATHSATYLVGAVIATIGALILLPVYTHALSPAAYGLLETILRFVNMCMIVAFVGLRQAFLRFYFDHDTQAWHKTVTSTAVAANASIAIVIVAPIVVLAALLIGQMELSTELGRSALSMESMIALSAWLLFESIFMLGLSFLQVQLRSKAFVLAQAARTILLVVSNYTLLQLLGLGLEGALLGNLITAVVSGLIAGIGLLRWSGVRISRPALQQMVVYGLPYIPSAVLMYVIMNADRFALVYFGAIASLGILSLASKIGEMTLNVFVSPIENVWAPYALRVRNDPDGPWKIGKMYTRYAALCVLLALGVSLLAPFVVELLATDAYEAASALVPIVAIGWVFGMLAVLSDIGILISKRTHLKPIIYALTALIAVCLQVVLTPRAGVLGAATATALSGIAMFLITRAVSSRLYRFVTAPRDFLSITLAAAFAYWSGHSVGAALDHTLGNVLAAVVGTAIYATALHFTRVITIGEIAEVANQLGLPALKRLLR
jgi:O-antigen/teichoic acid export membrane protein